MVSPRVSTRSFRPIRPEPLLSSAPQARRPAPGSEGDRPPCAHTPSPQRPARAWPHWPAPRPPHRRRPPQRTQTRQHLQCRSEAALLHNGLMGPRDRMRVGQCRGSQGRLSADAQHPAVGSNGWRIVLSRVLLDSDTCGFTTEIRDGHSTSAPTRRYSPTPRDRTAAHNHRL